MGCLLPIFGFLSPRLVLILIYFLTDWPQRAYQTTIWPIIGFLCLPLTTLVYMGAMLNNNYSVSGWWLVLVILAVFFDMGGNITVSSKKN